MANNLKQLVCDPDCGFLVRSHDENEIVTVGMSHLTNIHKMSTTAADIKGKIEPA
jgi:predicted small metal-binding protein